VPQVMLMFDPSLAVDATAMSEEWANDNEVRRHLVDPPEVHRQPATTFHLPGLIEYVVVPLAVNLGSSGLIEITKRLLEKYRPGAKVHVEAIETEGGDTTVVITDGEDQEETPS
jgi:hypothetical protein